MIDYVHVNLVIVEDGKKPEKQHFDDACFDMFSRADVIIQPMKWAKVPLGVAMAIPSDYVGIVKGRSGLTSKGVVVPTGTIDPNYRGEICAIVYNFNNMPFTVLKGDRICQFCITPKIATAFHEVKFHSDTTDRGSNGFGSTGIN